jgi:acyl carrier protein
MNQQEITEIIISTCQEYLKTRNINTNITNDTALIGNNAELDSLGLVTVLVDLEAIFLEKNLEITLTSEKAMSAKISPFRSVGSLANFIFQQINGQNG